MYHIIIVTNDKNRFSSFVQGLLAESDCRIRWVDSSEKARSTASDTSADLMVVDQEVQGVLNFDVAREIVLTNPMINMALVSPLSSDDFHVVSEGLGILAQLPPSPSEQDASKLMSRLRHIKTFE
jgi:DNA-binding response OmpR family regulator